MTIESVLRWHDVCSARETSGKFVKKIHFLRALCFWRRLGLYDNEIDYILSIIKGNRREISNKFLVITYMISEKIIWAKKWADSASIRRVNQVNKKQRTLLTQQRHAWESSTSLQRFYPCVSKYIQRGIIKYDMRDEDEKTLSPGSEKNNAFAVECIALAAAYAYLAWDKARRERRDDILNWFYGDRLTGLSKKGCYYMLT